MCIPMKRDKRTRLFLLYQIQGFMCNYKSSNIEDLQGILQGESHTIDLLSIEIDKYETMNKMFH